MRSHEGNQPARNLQVYSDAQQAGGFALGSRIYAALADYRRSVVAQSGATNLPAMRHPSLVVPGTAAATADDQFFLGEHLLVAPVMRPGATSVSVTFPPGEWRHILTGAVYAGDATTTVPAPIGTPAAFVRTDDPVGDQIRAAMQAAGLAP
jgi:alpha-glucosidase